MRAAANSSAVALGARAARASAARACGERHLELGAPRAASSGRSARCTRAAPRRRARAPPRGSRAVARSTASSCAASKASSARELGLEAGRGGVEAARLSHGRPRRSASIERRDRVALQLERRGVDDEAARDRHDLLDHAQPVGAQRVAGVDQVDDRVGEAHERRQLHRAVELDQVDVHALGGEVLARGADVLGRHAQARALLHRARRSRSPRAPRPPCGSARCRGRAAGRGPARRARRAGRGRPRRGRRRRTARRSARRRRAPGSGAGPARRVARISLRDGSRILGGRDARARRAAAASPRRCGPWRARA